MHECRTNIPQIFGIYLFIVDVALFSVSGRVMRYDVGQEFTEDRLRSTKILQIFRFVRRARPRVESVCANEIRESPEWREK